MRMGRHVSCDCGAVGDTRQKSLSFSLRHAPADDVEKEEPHLSPCMYLEGIDGQSPEVLMWLVHSVLTFLLASFSASESVGVGNGAGDRKCLWPLMALPPKYLCRLQGHL